MITSIESLNNVLKNYYLDALVEQLDGTVSPFLAQVKKTSNNVWGKDVQCVVRCGVNGGIGAGTETGELPAVGKNEYVTLTSSLKNLFGRIEISDKVVRASGSNEGAFVNVLNAEMDGLIKSANFNFGRMLFGDGSGKIATVTSANSLALFLDDVKNVERGMLVDLVKDGAIISSGVIIQSLDRNAKKAVVDITPSVVGVTAGTEVYIQGSKDLELTGLAAIFNGSQSIYGVNRNSCNFLKPYTQSEVGALSENIVQTAMDTVEELSGGRTNFILCSWGVKRALAACLAEKRVISDSITLNGGYRAMNFNGIPVVADRFCPAGTMYLLNTDDFVLNQLCDWQWLEGDDGSVLKQIPGKAAYTATLVKYADLMCVKPCGQAMLSGITEA